MFKHTAHLPCLNMWHIYLFFHSKTGLESKRWNWIKHYLGGETPAVGMPGKSAYKGFRVFFKLSRDTMQLKAALEHPQFHTATQSVRRLPIPTCSGSISPFYGLKPSEIIFKNSLGSVPLRLLKTHISTSQSIAALNKRACQMKLTDPVRWLRLSCKNDRYTDLKV